MTSLVVQAHPLEDSYSAALRERILRSLRRQDTSVTCHRLGQGERPDGEILASATRLVLVYPTWSGGLPAMLLDWVHETLDNPAALDQVEELVAVTTCGSSKLVNLAQGEWGRRYLKTSLLGHCRPSARFRWLPLYKIDRRSADETAAHLDKVEQRI